MIQQELAEWINYAGSFMQRLKDHGIQDAKIKVLHEKWQIPFAEEREKLRLPFRTLTLVREVLIHSEKQEWMVARTVIPKAMLKGQLTGLKNLKTNSLGSILFKQANIVRTPFEKFYLTKNTLWNHGEVQCKHRWARRSCFNLQHHSLLLTEIFLSGMDVICQKK